LTELKDVRTVGPERHFFVLGKDETDLCALLPPSILGSCRFLAQCLAGGCEYLNRLYLKIDIGKKEFDVFCISSQND